MGRIIKRGMVRDVALLLAGAVVYGIGTHCFVTPADIAPGADDQPSDGASRGNFNAAH